MADVKKQHTLQQQGQNMHLEKLNEQLQLYLLAQQGHERELTRRLLEAQDQSAAIQDVPQPTQSFSANPPSYALSDQLAAAAQAEIFGITQIAATTPELPAQQPTVDAFGNVQFDPNRTAFTHVPLALRSRHFGKVATTATSQSR
jgi:hypothetical protein